MAAWDAIPQVAAAFPPLPGAVPEVPGAGEPIRLRVGEGPEDWVVAMARRGMIHASFRPPERVVRPFHAGRPRGDCRSQRSDDAGGWTVPATPLSSKEYPFHTGPFSSGSM